MATTTNILTAEEFWNMPDNGGRNELVRGEVREMSPPSFRHGKIIRNISVPLALHVSIKQLGDISMGDPGFVLARKPDVVLAPDIAFLTTDHLSKFEGLDGWWETVPDLVIEVMSPNDTASRVEAKAKDWVSFGCPIAVVVNDRKKAVTVHRPGQPPRTLSGDDVFDGDDVVPGFRLPLSEIVA